MTIHCVGCRRVIHVPDERAENPRLRVKCGCGAVFALSEASIALSAPTVAPVAPPRPSAPVAKPAGPSAPVPAAARVASAPSPAPAPVSPTPPSASARPAVPQAAARPDPTEPAARVSFQATAAVGDGTPRSGRAGGWRRCVTHPQVRSQSICPQCFAGYCPECENRVNNAIVCRSCEALCIRASEYEERLERDRQRARPMMEELGTILSYPMRDPLAWALLAIITWVFAVLGNFSIMHGKMVAVLFSQGLLMAYCFTALSRVSGGNMKDFMPDIGEIGDLVRSLKLGVSALVAGSGPLLVMVLLIPGLALFGGLGQMTGEEAEAQPAAPILAEAVPAGDEGAPVTEEDVEAVAGEDGEAEAAPAGAPAGMTSAEAAAGLKLLGIAVWVLFLGGLALVWKVVYTPVALTVAGLSRSALSTLNPVVGIDTIKRMGGVYWQAMAIYTVVAAVQWVTGVALGFIPLAGGLARSFVDAYAYLVIGCTLGLAVFKKAPELGLE